MIAVDVQDAVDTKWGGYRLEIVTYTLAPGYFGEKSPEWVRCVPPKKPPILPRGICRDELLKNVHLLERVWVYTKSICGTLRVDNYALLTVPQDISDLELLACSDYTLLEDRTWPER
jgi:hypothetical protein